MPSQRPDKLRRKLALTERAPKDLRPPERRTRKHPARQRTALRASIVQRGFLVPLTVTSDGTIVDGVLRWELAQELGLSSIATICIDGVNRTERKLLSIALNRIPELAQWDDEALALDLKDLIAAVDLDFCIEASGFSTPEIDVRIDFKPEAAEPATPEGIEEPAGPFVSRSDDLWLIGGSHRLFCGNARLVASYSRLCGRDTVTMVCTDPPYNVNINGHVSGLGRMRHREFVEGSGELSSESFTAFLTEALSATTTVCVDGAVIMAAIDWRHMVEMSAAGKAAGLSLLNVCVWNKSNGGMGSLYRSQHELFFVFKYGKAQHINNVMLGSEGRYRTNVWSVPGQNSFGVNRDEELSLHPTTKPVPLIAEAIRDVSRHGQIVLEPFCGSGTALIAAERTGRRCYAMELDPGYVDVAVRRYQKAWPKVRIILAETGETFEEVEARRLAAGDFDEEVLPDGMWEII